MLDSIKQKYKIKLGYVPTRRDIFSKEEAGRYKSLIEDKIKSFGADVVNLEWLNDEGLLYSGDDVDKIAKKFQDEEVDALFTPHCNFGTEYAIGMLAKKLNKPLLLWGPRDDSPLPDGSRSRDSQCGLFATSKVLGRFGVPFTYITNSRIDDIVFERGFKNFLGAASVVKAFRNLRIGQISTRPTPFWSVMCNEGELLERFGIQIVPTTMVDIQLAVESIIKENSSLFKETVQEMKNKLIPNCVDDEVFIKVAALKLAIKRWCVDNNLSAVAIQCWDAMQDILGIYPCYASAELTDEGIPIACETDIHGAITSVMVQAARMGESPTFFADITVRHPEDDNGELLWHCGPYPHSLIKEGCKGAVIQNYLSAEFLPGVCNWEIKGGDITVARFDGLNGEYSLLMGHAKGMEGPKNRGTYVWVKVNDWPLWEEKLIYGPYIHHCVGIHGNIAPVLYEACRYIPGLKADPVDPTEEEIRKFLRG